MEVTTWEDIDPELLVKAYDDPMMFIEAILPHLPLTLSPHQIQILKTFYDPKKKYTELLLCCGRKSGKTLLVSIIALYEVYRLLLTENLHTKYHLIPNSPIYIMVTATSREQALDVTFQYIRSLAQGSWYLNDYIVRVTSEEIEFTKNIIIRCQACSSSSGRGYPTWANIYDEHAHMKLRSGNAGGDVIYDALQPNLKLFKGDGKTVTISSPSGMEGIFWELFSTGDPIDVIQKTEHQGEQSWRAVFQHPTWEMNPELGRNHPEIDKEFLSDYKSAEMEYGALFANVVDAALEPKAVDECALGVQIQWDVPEKTLSRIIVLDPATVGNEYAVAMGHLSDSPKKDMVIVDLVKTFSGSHKHPVDIEEVENFVRLLCHNFKIVHIGIDQHQSADTVQKFQREGLPIKMVNITPKYNEDMYKTFFRRVNTKHIVYPNLPEIKDELRFLQKRFVGWGWVVVAARGHMDDIPDCIANLCLLLEQLLSKKAEWGEMIRAITTPTDTGRKKIGLIQVDGKWPNLALMKLGTWHTQKGDDVTLIDISSMKFDRIYASKIFVGGSGYDVKSELPSDIEAIVPDYNKFKLDHAIGYTTRGCIRDCGFCLVRAKEGILHDVDTTWITKAKITLLDNNFLASKLWKEKLQVFIDKKLKVCFSQGLDIRLIDKEKAQMLAKVNYRDNSFKHKRLYFSFDNPYLEDLIVEKVKLLKDNGIRPQHLLFYVLVGYDTTFEQDMRRFYTLNELGCLPFIMIYNNRKDNKRLRDFARWVNKRYYKVCKFEDYDKSFRAITYEQEMELNHKCPKCGHEWTTVEIVPFELEPPDWSERD